MSDARSAVVDYLQRMLVGPADGPEEQVRGLPTKRYLMGILFPRESSTDAVLQEELEDVVGSSQGDLTADDPVALAGQWLPSSIGISVYVEGDEPLVCQVWGAVYEQVVQDKSRVWERTALATKDEPETVTVGLDATAPTPVLGGRGEIRLRCRSLGVGNIVTVSLVHSGTRAVDKEADPGECLFQVGVAVDAGADRILEYPSVQLLSRDPEEQELRLLHRSARTFAIGHGCAVSWAGREGERKREASSVLIPVHEVLGLTQEAAEGISGDVLSVGRLGDPSLPPEQLRSELLDFIGAFDDWIEGQESRGDVPGPLEPARDRIVHRLRTAAARMREGVEVLEDETVRKAFRLANEAMAIQRHRQSERIGGSRRPRGADVDMAAAPAGDDFRWYPFQLAFQLLVLPSLVDAGHEHRRDVDLIWFPTGGGKTEAYLAVAATEIFLRRLRDGVSGGGTAVFTRYTLRLLTTQQFQRAAATICACEQLRRSDPELGEEPISIGLWVGEAAAPNTFTRAAELYDDVRHAELPESPFQLEQCPWCGTEILPAQISEDDEDYGVRVTLDDFRFFCPHDACPFHAELPIHVVDEALYREPPTLLLGTVDKFAQLAWNAAGGAFFGTSGERNPPSLVIQDELHLLSGPLGTTVGVYEAAIESLCAAGGTPPKILASTATIRRSDDQVRGLFGGRGVKLFPPSGVDAGDSFYARVDKQSPGRLYVGVMAQSHTVSTAMVHLMSALLQGVEQLPLDAASRDAYWTLVAYHNSLRELGRTMTLARDDVPARLAGIAEGKRRSLGEDDVVELTSNVGGTRLPSILERMKQPRESDGAISVLACTNMLSVGVDVQRLGLMLMNGQPKTTSEYIQATSRVGRGEVPGLVVTVYTATKPRDRSHYEAFRPYHASLYRHVEPTSVTPWSPPSRDRALRGAFVILVRHLAGLRDNASAAQFDPTAPSVERATELLLERVSAADPDELDETARQLDRCNADWVKLVEGATEAGKTLYFRPGGKGVHSLLKNFGERGDGWPTLHSMRNVDRECLIKVRGEE